jgi:hypothetical protein
MEIQNFQDIFPAVQVSLKDSLYIKKLGIFYLSVSNLSNLRIFYLLKILANGIGHKLLQQLFKTVSYNLQQIQNFQDIFRAV